jgi:hypothetical protein
MWVSFSLWRSLEKEDLRNLGRKLDLLGEMSDRLSRDLDLLGINSVPASSTLDTDPEHNEISNLVWNFKLYYNYYLGFSISCSQIDRT